MIDIASYREARRVHIFTGNNGERRLHQCPAKWAVLNIKRQEQFAAMEADNKVRLRFVRDDDWRMDDLKGDTYDRYVNPDIQESTMARQEKAFEDMVERDGVWGIVGEYWNGREWLEADSCWGFVGRDGNDYEFDIMRAACDAYERQTFCPTCHQVNIEV